MTQRLSLLVRSCARGFRSFLGRIAALPPLRTATACLSRTAALARGAFTSFSHRERSAFYILTTIFCITALGALLALNARYLVTVPARGGSFTEGVIGAPRFVNPLLAISDTDRDLTAIIYSGLLRATPSGELIPDLAESYTVSDDGLTYTFTLKDGLSWHDGEPVTSDDVVFTIAKIQDSAVKSIKRSSWEGVSVERVSETAVSFTLARRYSPFLENATIGILPAHLWKDVTPEQFPFSLMNVEPVGTGPYRVASIKKNPSGIPASYDLASFEDFALGEAHIPEMRIVFYANEDELLRAFTKGSIDAVNAISSQKIGSLDLRHKNIATYLLPRVFGVFFNQNRNTLFADGAVRHALETSLDREAIINEVLSGYGTPLFGPLPPGSLGYNAETAMSDESDAEERLRRAIGILEKGGWKADPTTGIREHKAGKRTETLTFSIATSDAPELKKTAELIKARWEQLGASVDLKIFNAGDLNHSVIRPRQYDTLFFGEIIGRESDPFAFWHSSQRNDPGLNIALYANITTDKLLEQGRNVEDRVKREAIYIAFQKEVMKDAPAAFVYSPDFMYIMPERIQGVNSGVITVPSERFLDIAAWYIETDRVWKIFTH